MGEQTGRLPEVLRQLAEDYRRQILLRRKLSYPMLQLGLALLILRGMIWLMDLIRQRIGQGLGTLGIRPAGMPGLVIDAVILGAIGLGGFALWQQIGRGLLWTRPVQSLVMRIPALSEPLLSLALARLAWSLGLTLEAGMELRQALSLSLRSAAHLSLRRPDRSHLALDPFGKRIARGPGHHRCVSPRLIDAVTVGERSGRLSETMKQLSNQYQDDAQIALAMLAKIARILIWLGLAAMII